MEASRLISSSQLISYYYKGLPSDKDNLLAYSISGLSTQCECNSIMSLRIYEWNEYLIIRGTSIFLIRVYELYYLLK